MKYYAAVVKNDIESTLHILSVLTWKDLKDTVKKQAADKV